MRPRGPVQGPQDGDLRGRVAGGAVRDRLDLGGGLGVAGRVGGARLDQVIARRGRPFPGPLPPGVDAGHRGQPRLVPGAPVDPYLHGGNALVLRPGHAGHRYPARRERRAAGRHVDSGLGLDRRLLRPATLRPEGTGRRECGHLDVGDPLGRGHVAVQAGHHHPCREAVHDGQRRAVHGHREQGVPAVEHDRQGGARGEPVDRGAQQLIGTRQRAGLPDQVRQARAKPSGVSHVGPSDRVRDAGERYVGLDERAPQQVGEGEGHLASHHPVDPQPPGRRIDLGHEQGGVDPVETVIRGDGSNERAEAGDIEITAPGKRRCGNRGVREPQGGPRRGDIVLVNQVSSGQRPERGGRCGGTAGDQEPSPCGPAGWHLVIWMSRDDEGVGRARTDGRFGGVGRVGRPCGRGWACRIGQACWGRRSWRVGGLSQVGQLREQVGREQRVQRGAQPDRRADQPGQRERAGRGPHQGGNHVSRRGGRPGQGRGQADGSENRERAQAEREPAHREHPGHRRARGEDHQDAAEQYRLVVGAERGDGEILDLRRREIDGRLAHREHG